MAQYIDGEGHDDLNEQLPDLQPYSLQSEGRLDGNGSSRCSL